MSGQLDSPALPELVQMFAGGGHSVRISLISTDGSHGTVTIENGVVDQCRFGNLLGEEAFYALCGIAGRFTVTRTDPERHRRATVRRGWQELLMEAARLEDEASRSDHDVSEIPRPSSPATPSPATPSPATPSPATRSPATPSPATRSPATPSPSRPALRVVEDWFPADTMSATARPLGVAAKLEEAFQLTPDLRPEPEVLPISPPILPPPQPEAEYVGPEVVTPSDDDVFTELFANATKAYLLRNLEKAERMFEQCAEMRPEDRRVRANLKRLIDKRKEKEKG